MSDLISRQAAIEALGEEPEVWTDSDAEIAERNQWRMDVAAIEALPSAQPERKRGKWGADGECPFCGYLRQWDDDNFCANCGADMRGEHDEPRRTE